MWSDFSQNFNIAFRMCSDFSQNFNIAFRMCSDFRTLRLRSSTVSQWDLGPSKVDVIMQRLSSCRAVSKMKPDVLLDKDVDRRMLELLEPQPLFYFFFLTQWLRFIH